MVFNFGYFLCEMLTGLIVFPEQEPQLILNRITEPFRKLILQIIYLKLYNFLESLLRSIFAPVNKIPSISELMSCR